MKETELNYKVKTELSVKQKKQIEHEFIGNIVPHEGHKIWKVAKDTLIVTQAEYSNTNYIYGQEIKKEIIIKDGFFYVAALNPKNALKKYKQGLQGGRAVDSEPLQLRYF